MNTLKKILLIGGIAFISQAQKENLIISVSPYESKVTTSCQTKSEAGKTRIVKKKEVKLVDIPDAAFRTYLKNKISDAFPNGGEKMDANAEAVKTLKKINVYDRGIKSLQGIEHFTGLEVLNCSENQLKILDLSACKSLTHLYCVSNQLTSLNLSACKYLESLECCKNYTLAHLIIDGCKKLKKLHCHDNQLKSIEVSHNTVLTELYCWHNPLTSLDLSRNPKLNDSNVKADNEVKIKWHN